MDTPQDRRGTWVILLAAAGFAAAACCEGRAEESIFKRMVGAVSPRRTEGPVARLHDRIQERPSHRNDYQDGMVVHAGGAYAGQIDSLEGHGPHHARCRGGHCDDHCVVRPDRFGYYETRWRQWPGQQVVQAANNEALTPASPPQLQLPGEKEESLDPNAPVDFGVDEPVEDSDATTLPGLGPAVPVPRNVPSPAKPAPRARPPLPAAERDDERMKPADESPRPADQDTPPRPDDRPTTNEIQVEPEPKPEPKPPADVPAPSERDNLDNLFDDAAHRRRLQERLAVIRSNARPASVAPMPLPAEEKSKLVSERPTDVRESAPAAAEETTGTVDASPAVFLQDAGAKEGNPLRSAREGGWRARAVEGIRTVEH